MGPPARREEARIISHEFLLILLIYLESIRNVLI